MKKALKLTLELFFIFVLITYSTCAIYLAKIYLKSEDVEVTTLISDKITKVLDKDGNSVLELALTRDNNIEYKELPDVFINALISAEDARFYSHQGIDLQRIVSSLVNNISGGHLQGASTLTQQLIKNTILDSSKTLDRKLNEIILALKLE